MKQRYGRFNADPRSIINILNGTGGWSIVDRLPGLTRPVQVVVGDQDPTYVYCQEQGRMARGAEYVEFEKSGHFCILDQAARFNDAALDFSSEPMHEGFATGPHRSKGVTVRQYSAASQGNHEKGS